MKYNILLLAGLAAMLSGVQAGELFRWQDANGVVHYSDTPPVDVTGVERKELTNDVSPKEGLPYETRKAQQNFPVTLYVGDGCGESCGQARSLLSKRGVPYSEKLLRTRQDVEAFKLLSGIEGVVPVLGVGKNFLKGFSELQWNSELDIAGYPKTAGYRQGAAPPVRPVPFEPSVPITPPAQGNSLEGQATPAAQ